MHDEQRAPTTTRFWRTAGSLVVAGLVLCAPAPARSWGCEGHEVIAYVAKRQLTRSVLGRMEDLLARSPVDPHLERSCRDATTNWMVDASTWADDVRATDGFKQTAAWHFLDIPRGASRREMLTFCPADSGCLTSAVRDQLALLRTASDQRARANALRFVMHLLGDLHQPMHCITNNDLGGNCVPVAFFGNAPVANTVRPGKYMPNLHAVWDNDIINRARRGRSAQSFADDLDAAFAARIAVWRREPIDIEAWVWESHAAGEQTAYGKLPVAIAVETPQPVMQCTDAQDVAQRMLALHENVRQPYQDAAAAVVEEQLAKAGTRLAMLLNDIFR